MMMPTIKRPILKNMETFFDDTDNNILSWRRMTDAEYNSRVAGLSDSRYEALQVRDCEEDEELFRLLY